ncbi:MAG: hypothetical protein LBP57_03070 [Endomicrobium sp.]|nr:hypothetical protein [Endomicrobium sp.]
MLVYTAQIKQVLVLDYIEYSELEMAHENKDANVDHTICGIKTGQAK